jgi:hypothetical protein
MAVEVPKSLKSDGRKIAPGFPRLTFASIWLFIDSFMSQIYKFLRQIKLTNVTFIRIFVTFIQNAKQ